ncbi:hypothetical protein CRI94_14670 [Longibacter salinarum]|uniref:Lipid/polyisoprenoid-binding YceI-like domain-containing protein n=1 Tax=Longibacter salinarum TaxID=1850348 RepID=A0A2A8CUZ2_9BACT|nr:YceI family protein [Longibacter salinarum]PEN12274.1 hypothetical protein CRI94_14670 [Longibacter salinarum]
MTPPIPRFLAATIAAGLIILTGFAALNAPTYVFRAEPSDMTISGTSTLHDWTCDVQTIDGRLEASTDTSGSTPIQALTSTQVSIPVESIDCDKDRMNRNLYDAMAAKKYPTILFSLKEATVSPLPDSAETWMNVDAKGELIISGTRKTIDLPLKAEKLDDGSFRFVGETTFKMSSYGVDPPSVMLGTIKTGDEVTIAFDLVAAPPA